MERCQDRPGDLLLLTLRVYVAFLVERRTEKGKRAEVEPEQERLPLGDRGPALTLHSAESRPVSSLVQQYRRLDSFPHDSTAH